MVQIHDRVFSSAACALLHTAVCSRGLGHATFWRAQPQTPLEAALGSYLDEIQDSSPCVEYWSRTEWRHIEAHADVDERRAATKPEDPLQYPVNGHVLYLNVGSRVRGPTCVWQPDSTSKFAEMSAVPAVAGRVLRFDGRLQHAVPRPADVWLAPFAISPSGTPAELVRSVVLFNTWIEPPMAVETEQPQAATKSNPEDLAEASCLPRTDWVAAPQRSVPQISSDSAQTKTMKLWLLGDEARRGRPERTLPLRVDGAAVLAALEESLTVTTLVPPAPLDASPTHAASATDARDDAGQASPSSRATALAAALRAAASKD